MTRSRGSTAVSDICSAPGDDSEAAVMKSCAVNRASLIYPSEQMRSRNRRSGALTMLAANTRSTFIFIFNEAHDEDRATRQSRGLDTVLAKNRNIEMEDPRQLMSL